MIPRLLLFLLSLNLISCSTFIAKQINNHQNTADIEYPVATTQHSNLKTTSDIQLSQYKPEQTRTTKKSDFALALAISGGGYRSANLALGVLLGLEKENLLQEIDYFSTVSGGGLAAGFYLTKLHNYLENHSNANSFSLAYETNKLFINDKVKPNPFRIDLMQYVFADNPDKGLEIEKILNDTILHTKEGGLREANIFVPANSTAAVELPYWAINTTAYHNAAIFPFTPDLFSKYQIAGFHHNRRDYYFPNPSDISSMYSMPMSVGLMASMSVPIALPSTTLVSQACTQKPCYLQLYDGGIADNLGINTALNLLLQDKRKVKILMVIDSGNDLNQPFSALHRPPKDMPLAVRLTTISTDGYRKYIKSHLKFITQKILCDEKTSHVIVIYFDLEGYPYSQHIRSDLRLSLQEQLYLIKLGQELVMKDKALQDFIVQSAHRNLTMGSCNQLS